MTQNEAAQAVREDMVTMKEGESKDVKAAVFELAFQVLPSPAAIAQGFLKPTITAETGFRMQFPQWGCTHNRTFGTYTITKPRGNPYALR